MYKKKVNLKTAEWISKKQNPTHETNQTKWSQTTLRAYPQKAPNLQICNYFSLQIIHITQCGTKFQTFEECFPNQFIQPASKSITLLGRTQETPKDLRAKLHNRKTSPQCRSKWSTLSPLHLHRQHQSIIVQPLFLKWSVVRTLTNAAVPTKNDTPSPMQLSQQKTTHDLEPSHPKYSSKEWTCWFMTYCLRGWPQNKTKKKRGAWGCGMWAIASVKSVYMDGRMVTLHRCDWSSINCK